MAPDAYSPAGWNWLAQLIEEGWTTSLDFVPADLAARLTAEAVALHEEDRLRRAGVGRVDDHLLDRDIRRDRIRWFDRATPTQSDYLDLMETLRLEVNRALFMGLFSYEAHFAVYEPGGFYVRHLDAFRGARNRVLSTVLYLNDDWREEDGGQLVIYPREMEEGGSTEPPPVAFIPPEARTLAVFLSEEIPHEVRAVARARYSIAGWFRVNDRLGAPTLQAVS